MTDREQDRKTAAESREALRAQALRANLRRRKAATTPPPTPKPREKTTD
jgi:hypothetical protein